jgi:hypothetical protein
MISLFFLAPMTYFSMKVYLLLVGIYCIVRNLSSRSALLVRNYSVFLFLWCAVLVLHSVVQYRLESLVVPLSVLLLMGINRHMISHYTKERFQPAIKLFLFVNILILLDSFLQISTGTDIFGRGLEYGRRLTGPYPNNYLDTLFFPLQGFLVMMLIFTKPSHIVKYIIYLVLFSNLVILPMTGTRSSILSLFFSLYFTGIFSSPRHIITISVIVSSFIFVSIQIIANLMPLFTTLEQLHYRFFFVIDHILYGSLVEADIRFRLWIWVWEIIMNDPIILFFGNGYDTLSELSITSGPMYLGGGSGAHNFWLDLLYATGLSGVVLFVGFLLFFIRAHIMPCRKYKWIYRLQIFQLLWFIGPFNIQHHFNTSWFTLNIFISLFIITQSHKLVYIQNQDFGSTQKLQ